MCGKLPFYQGLIWSLSSKESTYQCRRRQFNPWVRKIPWRRARLPIPVLLGFAGGSDGKESTCNAADLGSIPGLGRSLEEGMAAHSSIPAWRIPWTGEPGRLQCMGSQSQTWLRELLFHFHPRSAKSETLGVGPKNGCLDWVSRWCWGRLKLRTTGFKQFTLWRTNRLNISNHSALLTDNIEKRVGSLEYLNLFLTFLSCQRKESNAGMEKNMFFSQVPLT